MDTPYNFNQQNIEPHKVKNILTNNLVILEQKGRLGNRLQTAAYSLVYAQENKVKVFLYCLLDYDNWFVINNQKGLKKLFHQLFYQFCLFLVKHRKVSKILKVQVLHSGPKSPVILSNRDYHDLISSNFITIVKGYYIYSDPKLLFDHKTTIEKSFIPLNTNIKHIKNQLNNLKQKFSVVVGVHIRHGDYKDYRGGKYFLSFDDYYKLLKSLVDNETQSKIYFIICSDASIPENVFNKLDWECGPGDVLGDLFILSLCDFVLGPPSTFNRWSAFYGNSPRLEVDKNTTNICLSNFSQVTDLTFRESKISY